MRAVVGWFEYLAKAQRCNDGLNDFFKPLIDGHLVQYKLTIYDLNGQVVLHTTDSGKGWDGTYKDAHYNTGIFIWMCTYQRAERLKQKKARSH